MAGAMGGSTEAGGDEEVEALLHRFQSHDIGTCQVVVGELAPDEKPGRWTKGRDWDGIGQVG